MFVILAAKSLFFFLFVRLLVVGAGFEVSVNAAAIVTTAQPLLGSLATLAAIPTSCNNTCNDIQATIIDCDMVAQCVCTSSNTASLDTCVDCLEAVEPNNQTVIAAAQNILNQYVALCDGASISVPIQTASGFTGSVVLPTTAASSPAGQSTVSEPATGGEPPHPSQSTTGLLTSQGVSVSSSTFAQTSGSAISTVVPSASSTASSTVKASTSSSASPSATTVGSSGGNRMSGESFTASTMLGAGLLFGILLSWAP